MRIKFPIIGIDVFLEKRKTKMRVGVLRQDKNQFIFTYDEVYLHSRNIIPLGPEFPLTKREFRSKNLFPSFEDRIPSRQNPAYPEYCQSVGIDPQEQDSLILLSTIGKRGPSSFVFEPVYNRLFTAEDLIQFRHSLHLTTREFAQVFEISQASLNALERKRKTGTDLLKRIEIIARFPATALYLLALNGGALPYSKRKTAEEILRKQEPLEPEF